MNGLIQPIWRKQFLFSLVLLLCCWGKLAAKAGQLSPGMLFATNICELRGAITLQSGSICAYDLEGIILAANCHDGMLFFQDNSGTAVLAVNLNGIKFKAGERIRLRGTNYVSYNGVGLSLGTQPVIDADNLHSALDRYAEIRLKAGYHPVRVDWFNQTGAYSLDLAYAGPHIVKQQIPPLVLFRSASTKSGNVLPGLNYRCFEGHWEKLPDFGSLLPQKIGVVSNFNIAVETREENVGLEFDGFLKVPEDGNYTFYLSSDDGSQLFLDNIPPKARVIGSAPVPAPESISVNQPLPSGQNGLWAEVEGTITYMSQGRNCVEMELTSGENRMEVEVLNNSGRVPWYLLNSRVRVSGVCPKMKNSDGREYAGAVVVADWQDVSVLWMAPKQWSSFQSANISDLCEGVLAGNNGIIHLHGMVQTNPVTHKIRFADATGSASIKLLTQLPTETNSDMDCLCQWSRAGTNIFLNEGVAGASLTKLAGNKNPTHVLTTALEVQQLTREEASNEYPVEIHGVVTSVSKDFRSLVIQDSTRGVFVWIGDESPESLPHVGDYCNLQGISRPADFSPIVLFRKATVLWKGHMPQPIRPTRDQLLSGNLDSQYVEIRGLVIETHDSYMTLLTAEGMLDLDIDPAPGERWRSLVNSIVRVRGCLTADWDSTTHQVIIDPKIQLNIWNATFSVDSPPPINPFAAELVSAKDLTQFDVRFDTFRRVKVCGQIIHGNRDIYYLMDGETGLRFQLAKPAKFNPGDEVEVEGLVDLEGVSPALRQAVAHKTGHSSLPIPGKPSLNSLNNSYDSTFVSVAGTLVDIQNHGSEQTLEIQVGVRNFIARLHYTQQPIASWTIGSRLQLTGTFSALDGDRMADKDVNSFELLLNSPEDVRLIARPPWWTLTRLLVAVTCLLTVLTLAFVWIALLRHRVECRTQQLGREISERERVEKLRAIEQERSRIARDLHDDLGSTLTEISMMATTSPGQKMEFQIASDRLQEIAEKSRSMISALDGVVWVVNSKNDTLSSLIEYLASNAEEFLAKAGIACRIELPRGYSDRIIGSEIRHDVMLAVREAINNAVRHGQPNEVLLRMAIDGDNLKILIQDDGCGFNPKLMKGNGLVNLQDRMKMLDASCQIESVPGEGTSVTLRLALPKQALL